ncbi:hypothetical protein HYU07_01660 [Candidatus Woesearchaeota archaeon]|nr:hypothetical protein [Candidatus Woesearchaeota archaeon]
MQETNILGVKRASKLKKLIYNGVPAEDALTKVLPRKKVRPIYDAWNYLVNKKIIETANEPHVAEQYQDKLAPFIKWGDDAITRWAVLTYSYYLRKELEIRDVLTDLVRKRIPNFYGFDFRKEDKALLEKASQEHIKEGNLEERSERFYTLLGVNVVNRASATGLLKFRPHQTNGEALYLYSCIEDNFGEFSEDIKMLPDGDFS